LSCLWFPGLYSIIILCGQSRFLFIMMILSKCMCTVIITWMIRMRTFSSVLMSCPLRIFNFKAKCISVCKFIIPKYHLFVAGDIHQSHERFSDISQGKQCAVMSFSAMFNTSCWLKNWQLPEQIRFLPREIDSIWKPCHLIICSLFLSAYCFHTSNHITVAVLVRLK